jgi:hypothetical protein
MKTYTLEELKAAQAKGCRIEYCDVDDGDWFVLGGDFAEKMSKAAAYKFRVHPADEWKARLPRLKDGAEWCCKGTSSPMGFRPRVVGELVYGEPIKKDEQDFSSRPVPPEFLHESELAKQSESAPQPPCDCIEKCGKFWIQRCSCHNSGDLANAEAWCQEQNRYPEAVQAPDFGEPWSADTIWGDIICDNTGIRAIVEVFNHESNPERRPRIIACVNALRGVPDPAEFVRQAKEMREAIREAFNSFAEAPESDAAWLLTERQKTALSKLKPFLP